MKITPHWMPIVAASLVVAFDLALEADEADQVADYRRDLAREVA